MKQYRYLVSFSSRSGMGSAYVTRTRKFGWVNFTVLNPLEIRPK